MIVKILSEGVFELSYVKMFFVYVIVSVILSYFVFNNPLVYSIIYAFLGFIIFIIIFMIFQKMNKRVIK